MGLTRDNLGVLAQLHQLLHLQKNLYEGFFCLSSITWSIKRSHTELGYVSPGLAVPAHPG